MIEVKIIQVNENVISRMKELDDECYYGYNMALNDYLEFFRNLEVIVSAFDGENILTALHTVTSGRFQLQ